MGGGGRLEKKTNKEKSLRQLQSDQIGRIFWVVFVKLTEMSQNFGLLYQKVKVMHKFCQKRFELQLWTIFQKRIWSPWPSTQKQKKCSMYICIPKCKREADRFYNLPTYVGTHIPK
jgi:hypothetical protein